MMKSDRLQRIRERAKTRIPLSENAANTLELLKKDDPDLGGETFGECLPPPKTAVRTKPEPVEDEENEVNTELLSPAMKAAMEV